MMPKKPPKNQEVQESGCYMDFVLVIYRSSRLLFNRSRKSYRGGVSSHEWSRGGKQWLAGAFTGENPSGKLFVMFSNQSINQSINYTCN